MENISPHGYIRNTPSDTEVHAEHQLRVARSTYQWKRIYAAAKSLQSCPTLCNPMDGSPL